MIFAYLLIYPGIDALAKHGVGAISYPLLIASCIAGFFLNSVLILREKNSAGQYIAIASCLAGIILRCQ